MEPKTDIQAFLTSRRARLTPEEVGLTAYGARRVPGLRREEVAVLAGVSVPYYTRLERGNMSGVSESVLEALSRALQLDDAERAYLCDLARSSGSPRPPALRRRTQQRIRPSVQHTLDAMTGAAASVRDERLDVLADNRLWRALYADMYSGGVRPANMARFVFLNPKAAGFYTDWEGTADEAVAVLHSALGRDPHDRRLTELVGELSTQSDAFRVRWAAHDVRIDSTGMRGSVTRSSEISACPTRPPSSSQTPASPCSPTPPNQAQSPSSRSTSWEAGRPRSISRTRPIPRTAMTTPQPADRL